MSARSQAQDNDVEAQAPKGVDTTDDNPVEDQHRQPTQKATSNHQQRDSTNQDSQPS
ncbi:hypothetical protein AX16_001958, partial [Volvariella volvacea WC 439]